MFDYPVTLTQDGDTILVRFKDVPGAITFGEDTEDALRHAVDALESALSFYTEDSKDLPKASSPKRGQLTVCPSPEGCLELQEYVENRRVKLSA